jgi:YVTN family beta-propeller protein
LALSDAGDRLYVANSASNELLIANVDNGSAPIQLLAGNDPYAVALSNDGELLAVANRLARPVPPRTLPVSELTLVDPQRGRVLERRLLESAHLSEGVAIASDASFVLASISRVRNLLPLTQVARGAVMNSAIAFIETRPDGRTVQFPLSEVNAYFADPSGVVLTPDDRIAFIAHGGAQIVTAVDVGVLRRIVAAGDASALDALADDMGASLEYVIARIPTRENPQSLAISPDGRRVYVAERLADSIAVIDTERLEVIERIDLGGPEDLTAERRGERLFHNAGATFQGQFSCRSCHPDGHSDGLIWDFEIDGVGENLLDTRSLLGIRDTAPFKWSGKNPDLQTQCGPRFARILTRSDPFTPQQLEDLVAYINSLALPPVRLAELSSEALERGHEIFNRTKTNSGEEIPVAAQCATCHRPPLFTNRLVTDVGTGGGFDTPHLFGVGSSAPYLHDGRSLTLEEIWTVHSPDDEHGATNDLSKVQLNQLMIYLRSL